MRKTIEFNDDWLFHEHDLHQNGTFMHVFEEKYDDSNWRKISVPHDSSIEGKFDKNNPSNARGGYASNKLCFYRKHFIVNNEFNDKRVFIIFEGVYCNSSLYINGELVGTYPYGYTTFRYDITDYIRFGEENIIAMKVDNELQPASRWYSGTGIYRPVKLELVDNIRFAYDETIITTPSCNEDKGQVNVRYLILNNKKTSKVVTVETSIYDMDDKLVAQDFQKVRVGFKNKSDSVISFIVDKPQLWCNKNPYLYTCKQKIVDGDDVLDNLSIPFGIRTIEFTTDNGFIINGKKEMIKGVCIHHDNGCLGACAYKEAFIRKIEAVKKMGANAIRTSHNPEAPEFLELCDRYGMYVMEEAFDEWTWGKRPRIFGEEDMRIPIFAYAKYFKEWSEKDLSAMIRRDRNHPSIVIWSVGNEIEELKFKCGEQITEYLVNIVHEHDKTRPATVACNGMGEINNTLNPDIVDVCGYNYAEKFYAPDHIRKPNRAIIGSETASITAFEPRGCYKKFLSSYNMNSNLDNDDADPEHQKNVAANSVGANRVARAENSWKEHIDNPFVAGLYIWTGIDYLGETTPEVWPSISSYFGPIDRALFPKDAFYFYRSIWSDEDVLHIFPHWNLKGYEGKKIPVWCYTNCDQVELFVNDVSVGKKTMSKNKEFHIEFDGVEYQPGELKAIGYRNGKRIEKIISTTGKDTKINISSDRKEIKLGNLVYVTVSVHDEDGNVVPDVNNTIRFECSNELELLGSDNGLQTNHSFKSDEINIHSGYVRAIFKAVKKGSAAVSAVSVNGNCKGSKDIISVETV